MQAARPNGRLLQVDGMLQRCPMECSWLDTPPGIQIPGSPTEVPPGLSTRRFARKDRSHQSVSTDFRH